VTLTFSEPVNVTGTPQLTLETGTTDAVADYTSGSGTDTLTFDYTVAAGHTSADLGYISADALALNGGTIKNLAGDYDADLTLPAPGSANSLGGNRAIVIIPNTPPVANADTYTTDEDTPLTVPVSGVLANDTDGEGNPLTALLADNVSHGSLTLNGDGSFTCTPNADWSGTDTFTYNANDGGTDSVSPATVTITVNAVNDAPVITGHTSPVTPEETELTLTLSHLTVTDPDNTWPGDFILTVQDGDNYPRTGNTITPVADFNGTLTVPVTVSDGTDTSEVFSLEVTVTEVSDVPMIIGQNPLTTPEETALEITLGDLTVTDSDSTYPDDFTLTVQDGTDYDRTGSTVTPSPGFTGTLTVPVTVSDGTDASNPFDLTVTVIATKGVIRGTVTDENGAGVPGITVQIMEKGNRKNRLSETTDDDGGYEFTVSPGTWMITAADRENIYSFIGRKSGKEKPEAGQTATTDVRVEKKENRITGYASPGKKRETLTDADAWAYARFADSPQPVGVTRLVNGEFVLTVPSGTLRVGLITDPGSDFVSGDETEITVGTAGERGVTREDREVVVFLRPNDAVIKGVFQDPDGNPVSDVTGNAFAVPAGDRAAWQESDIAEGQFEISVASGRWDLSYGLEGDGYMTAPADPVHVTVGSGETATETVTLTPLSRIVRGVVTDDTGSPAAGMQVRVRLPRADGIAGSPYEADAVTDTDGRFETFLPSAEDGWATHAEVLTVTARCGDPGCVRESRTETVLPAVRGTRGDGEVTSGLRRADMLLTGTVTDDEGNPVPGASVSASCPDGGRNFGHTDENGAYSLPAVRSEGNPWTLTAAYESPEDGEYYRGEISCDASETGGTVTCPAIPLESAGALPFGDFTEFSPELGAVVILSDGARVHIPGDAVSSSEDSVILFAEPVAEGLPESAGDHIVTHGYALNLHGAESFTEITELDRDILVTLSYSGEHLVRVGIRSRSIRPAYLDEDSDAWVPVRSFALDESGEKITFRTDHLSVWAIIAAETGAESVPGDADNDGAVTLADVIAVLQVCAEIPPSRHVSSQADISGDGKIGLAEAVSALQEIAE